MKNKKYGRPNDTVAFADGYPLSVGVQQSYEWLIRQIQRGGGTAPHSASFRANVVVEIIGFEGGVPDGPPAPGPFGDLMTPLPEDGWESLTLEGGDRGGSIRLVKPCARCVMTTINQESGECNADNEPTATLSRYRLQKSHPPDRSATGLWGTGRDKPKVFMDVNAIPDLPPHGSFELRVGDVLAIGYRR